MEKGIEMETENREVVKVSLLARIKEEFACKEVDIRAYSPLPLAYIGDCIYDLVIRTVVVERANRSPNELHKRAIQYVNAGTQAQIAIAIQELLTEEEKAIYRRGKNAKFYTSAKNATKSEYKKATGLEALFGYLYLQDNMDRVFALIKAGFAALDLEL